MTGLALPESGRARIIQDGTRVILVVGDKAVLNIPGEVAVEIGRVLIAQGRKAEEIANSEQVIMDNAIITRAGLRFGLALDPRIALESAKEAAWNSQLRRKMPHRDVGGVVYAPTVRRQRRRTDGDNL